MVCSCAEKKTAKATYDLVRIAMGIVCRLISRIPVGRLVRKIRRRYRRTIRPQVIKNHGIWLPVGKPLSEKMQQILYAGSYEMQEVSIIQMNLDCSDRVLELGTGIGFITTLIAKTCGSDSVFSYEANPEMIPLINEVFDLNGVRPVLRNVAVAKEAGEFMLHITEEFWSSSFCVRKNTKSRIKCNAVCFDQILKEIAPTFLVVDIEGGEYGLVGTQIHHSVSKFMIELHEHVIGRDKIEAVRDWILKEGFYIIDDYGNNSIVYLERP